LGCVFNIGISRIDPTTTAFAYVLFDLITNPAIISQLRKELNKKPVNFGMGAKGFGKLDTTLLKPC
jgi:hypothetical protein